MQTLFLPFHLAGRDVMGHATRSYNRRSSIILWRRRKQNIYERIIKEKKYNNQSWKQTQKSSRYFTRTTSCDTRFYDNFSSCSSQRWMETPVYRTCNLLTFLKYCFQWAKTEMKAQFVMGEKMLQKLQIILANTPDPSSCFWSNTAAHGPRDLDPPHFINRVSLKVFPSWGTSTTCTITLRPHSFFYSIFYCQLVTFLTFFILLIFSLCLYPFLILYCILVISYIYSFASCKELRWLAHC